MKVGTRELKNRLSYYLKRLSAEEPLYVTARGKVIAEIRLPPRGAGRRKSDKEVLRALAQEGDVTIGRSGPFKTFKPSRSRKPLSLSRIILDERR